MGPSASVDPVTRAEPPFFLVGNPRSGTKMLRELLNKSPHVWISDIETDFIPEFTATIGRFGDLRDRQNFDRCAEALSRTRAFWYWTRRGITIDRERWYGACASYDWAGVLEGLYHCVHDGEIANPSLPWNEILWGDKTPAYMMHVPLLSGVFPHARFVHLVRDPRDCALSAEQAWGSTPVRYAQRWADRIRMCRAAGRELGPGRYTEVRYEDLISNVTATLGRIFGFLGVPTPPDAGTFLRVPENLGAAKGANRVIAENRQKWKTRMSPAMRERIERYTGDLLDAFDYEREYPAVGTGRLSAIEMEAYRLRDAWRHLRFQRRELGSWTRGLRYLLMR